MHPARRCPDMSRSGGRGQAGSDESTAKSPPDLGGRAGERSRTGNRKARPYPQ